MENSEFDNFFRGKMKGVEAPDFSNQEWNKLVTRLDMDEPKGGLDGLANLNRMIMGLGLLLLLSNLFWGWAWFQSRQEINGNQPLKTPTEAIHPAFNTPSAVVVNTDTIHRTVVVHQYDTLHHYVKYHHSVEKSALSYTPSSKTESTSEHAIRSIKDSAISDGSATVTTSVEESSSAHSTKTTNNTTTLQQDDKYTQLETPISNNNQQNMVQKTQSLALLPTKIIQPLVGIKKPNLEYVAVQMPKVHKKRVDVLSMITPKSVSLGATFGLHNLSDGLLHESEGRTYGVVASVGINKHLDLTISGLCTKNEFGGKTYDQRLGLPAYMPPSEMYDFRYFEVEEMKMTGYQLGLGLKYGFTPEKKLNPILGIAYTNQWLGSYKLEMEYTQKITGEGYEEFFIIDTQKSPNGFLEPQAGIVYNKSQHWKFELLGYYQHKVVTSTLGVKQNWGLRSSLLYQF